MNSNSDISHALIQAYQSAIYRIYSSPKCVLKVGEMSKCASELLAKNHARSATILTAFNPYSDLYSDEQNLFRHRALFLKIKQLEVSFLDASGEDQIGTWKPERGYCIFDLDRTDSLELAKQFAQNAYIFIDSKGLVSLELTR